MESLNRMKMDEDDLKDYLQSLIDVILEKEDVMERAQALGRLLADCEVRVQECTELLLHLEREALAIGIDEVKDTPDRQKLIRRKICFAEIAKEVRGELQKLAASNEYREAVAKRVSAGINQMTQCETGVSDEDEQKLIKVNETVREGLANLCKVVRGNGNGNGNGQASA